MGIIHISLLYVWSYENLLWCIYIERYSFATPSDFTSVLINIIRHISYQMKLWAATSYNMTFRYVN